MINDQELHEKLSEIAELLKKSENMAVTGFFFAVEQKSMAGTAALTTFAGYPGGGSPQPWAVKGWLHHIIDENLLGISYEETNFEEGG